MDSIFGDLPQPVPSQLFWMCTADFNTAVHAALEAMGRWRWFQINIEERIQSNDAEHLSKNLSETEITELIKWLAVRMQHVIRLGCNRASLSLNRNVSSGQT